MNGEFSAYVNNHTGVVAVAKKPNEIEYENNIHFSPITRNKVKRDLFDDIEQYFEINYIPVEERVIVI